MRPEIRLLDGVRVLDLTDDLGLYAGKVLADLGAEVIMVEPPGGSPARRSAPFLDPADEASGSAIWASYCRSKKSVVLDLDLPADRALFLDLVRTAQIVLESDDAGRLEQLGIGASELLAANPSLVHTAISQFGRGGPKAHYLATDLIAWAASGALYPAGGAYTPSRDGDRPPVRISQVPQAPAHVGADAAAGALIAYIARRRDGIGQRVEVNAQQSMGFVTMGTMLAALVGHPEPVPERVGDPPRSDMFKWPTADGVVTIWLSRSPRLWQLIRDRGAALPDEPNLDVTGLGERYVAGTLTAADVDMLDRLAACIGSFTNDELLQAATEYGLLLGPILDVAQIAASPHLADRDFWTEGGVRHARGPVLIDGVRVSPSTGSAPAAGEHTAQILDELPRSPAADAATRATRAAPVSAPALQGLRVLDLAWVVAGPAITRTLADFGATVVKVEPPPDRGSDTARLLIPHHDGVMGPDRSLAFQDVNAGKLGIMLDLRRADDLRHVEALVRWADVVVESFAPGTLDRLGLGYRRLVELNPDVILVSTSVMGASGRYTRLKGTGQIAGAVGGIEALTGWPDHPAIGMPNAYTDIVAPRVAVPALLAALLRRDRDGVGGHIDISQMEAGVEFLAPALESYLASGIVPTRAGNADAAMSPHGVYPARPVGCQHEAWVAIAVRDDDDFRALADVLQAPPLASDPRFHDEASRRANAAVLDSLISEWTARRPANEAEALLQSAGVPAHAVLDSAGVVTDPQIGFNRSIVSVPHPLHGNTYVENARFRLSRTPAVVERAAPMLDEHRAFVLGELVGTLDGTEVG